MVLIQRRSFSYISGESFDACVGNQIDGFMALWLCHWGVGFVLLSTCVCIPVIERYFQCFLSCCFQLVGGTMLCQCHHIITYMYKNTFFWLNVHFLWSSHLQTIGLHSCDFPANLHSSHLKRNSTPRQRHWFDMLIWYLFGTKKYPKVQNVTKKPFPYNPQIHSHRWYCWSISWLDNELK